MPGATRKCVTCNQFFLKDDMVQYASTRAKKLQWYCKSCYEKKIEQDKFTDAVCKIFGIKMPGPVIWRDRKKLIDTYGYTDQTIIDCLDYVYNVKKMKKTSESLVLITPAHIHEMLEYKKQKSFEITHMTKAFETEMIEHIIPTPKRKKQIKKVEYDPEEWLDD